jgi:hypothetical protein
MAMVVVCLAATIAALFWLQMPSSRRQKRSWRPPQPAQDTSLRRNPLSDGKRSSRLRNSVSAGAGNLDATSGPKRFLLEQMLKS